MPDDNQHDINEIKSIVDQLRPILAGHQPQIQSAAIADLLAIYLAGYIIRNNPTETQTLREQLLDTHLDLVRLLVPINASMIHGKT